MRLTKTKKINKKGNFIKNMPLTMLALPGILFLFVFNYIPLYGLVLPFKNYKIDLGFLNSPWEGLNNFKYLFIGNDILIATRNTVLYNIVFIFAGTAISVVIALLLFEISRNAVKTYQTILLLPHFISWVVLAFAVKGLFDMNHGMLNSILSLFGKEKIMWYNEVKYWPAILIAFGIWKGMGYSAIVYYATLMGIDKELFEAAMIDGAGKIKQMRYISVPALKSILTIMIILKIGQIFYGDFGLFYNLPLNSPLLYPATDVIDTFVYRSLIVMGDIGMSSAAGFYQAVVGFILVLATNLFVRKIDSENALF